MPGYTVGIDLGTTHTVVACADRHGHADTPIRLFEIDQLVAPGEVAARPLLPSVRYHPAAGELAPGATALPWPSEEPAVIGELARRLGAQVPGRLVASAKSWLSHTGVDRLADILPWGAAEEVPKVSPVAASASYLAHVRAAWNQRHPGQPLEAQEIVLTVPASFDDAARSLTLQAAREAGLPDVRLLEEPQAALYDWLFRHRQALAQELAATRLVLVCDVGGGTTDLSLVKVDLHGGEPRLERVAVGSHLMLGGDNMDLALAHLVERRLGEAGGAASRLSAGQLAHLVERCRAAKEQLLAADAPPRAAVTLLGGGTRLVGGARTVELERVEVERAVIDGFFPEVAAHEPLRRRAGGLVALGLPYESDPAITRHIGAFLRQHANAGWPDALLLNGGVFRAAAIAQRLQSVLAGWRGAPVRSLHHADPDVAVARGAVAYALARRGLAPRIASGSPRSYFLLLGDDGQRGVCVLPRGSEEGHELRLEGRRFALRVGEPVGFHLGSATADPQGRPPLPGAVLDLADIDVQPLPTLATVVRAASGAPARGEISVELAAQLTEVGTLDLHCIAADDPAQRWKLEFQLRRHAEAGGAPAIAGPSSSPAQSGLPARFGEAVQAIELVFGAHRRELNAKAVKQLRAQLEAVLGPRERWSATVLRALFDALLQRQRGRRRSADHERLWLSLAGWGLRPGFGDPLDGWRIEQLWPLYEQGVQHGHDAQVNAEWWTLWRRAAGGLNEAAQGQLLEDFAFVLRGDEAGITERPPRLAKGGWDDMVRLVASLERVPAAYKVEVGDWLLSQYAQGRPPRHGVWTLWALGRLGARVPLYGSAHEVVAPAEAQRWLDALLAFDWKRCDGAAAAAANVARRCGDLARDLTPDHRIEVIARLEAVRAPQGWIDRVREVAALDEVGLSSVYGESLPPGLKLLD
jgi:molecular chaperone DnaK (HSP70)